MTAATYDFTLNAARSSASQMVVELQPDTTSTTPGTDARWQGGRPRITLNWAANVLVAQGTVNTAGNTTVDGNGVYKWVKISSTPTDLALDISQLGTVTIVDDDTAGGGNTTVYGPQTVGDTGSQEVGSSRMRMEHPYVNARVAGSYMLGLDANGNGVALHQTSDTNYALRKATNGSVGDPAGGSDPSILGGSQLSIGYADGDQLAVELVGGKVTVYKNNAAITGGQYPYDVADLVKGTKARYVPWAGSTVTNLKIIRLA